MSQPPVPQPPETVYGWADAPVSGDRVDVHLGPLVAGDPLGARVEVTATGLHAYDATGTETARIQGEGGEFVGGEFRTSDALPGQVTLSDTAHQGTPGMSIEPDDPTGYDVLPSIGPGPADMSISGGVSTDGAMSGANFNATGTSIYHNGPGENGAGAWSAVNSSGVEMRYRTDRTQLTPQSLIRAYAGGAQIVGDGGEGMFSAVQAQAYSAGIYTERPGGSSNLRTNEENAYIDFSAGGVTRGITVDATGVWVKTGTKSYNLEQTAQDSGWQSITLASGLAGGWSPAWRNKGGVIYMRGRVTKTGDWTTGWNVLATDVGPDARPASHIQRPGATRGAGATFLEVTTAGVLQVWFDTAQPGSTTVELSPMLYPLG